MIKALLLLSALVFSNAISSTPATTYQDKNPFERFFGEWTLKNDDFRQIWDGKTLQEIKIPNHHTECKAINTDKSVLCVVDAGDLKGHILWSFNGDTKTVHHLSHFGTSRNGVGTGSLDKDSNLTLKVSFQGEPEGSYRVYEYKWKSKDEYTMMSRQYDKDGKLTGNFYAGTFVRITKKKS